MSDTATLDADLVPNLQRLRDDFEFFARNCLRIRSKSGDLIPLKLNRGQLHLHAKLEAQRSKTRRVRALIVKGRQMGISTYIQARYYWRLWGQRKGTSLKAYILTHHDDATSNLFGMAQRFHQNLPEGLRPPTTAASAKELVFADTGCGYSVATAGSREVGRSDTIQLFHGSEVPSWPNAEDHVASILRTALARADGTESILEATAKGIGNVFHRYAMAALREESEYEAIFIPWYWDDTYRVPCPASFAEQCPDDLLDYAQHHKLEWDQLYWMYLTNREFAQAKSQPTDKICWVFRQEYPGTFEEAFQTSGDSFIPSLSVLKARRPAETIIGRGPIILGVDPALVRDNTGIIDRCGRRMGERICEAWAPEGDTIYLAERIANVIDRIKPDAVNIDIGNNGAGVFDQLLALGYGYCLNAINFGSRPRSKGPTGHDLYLNRRAEMYDLLRAWFETEGGVQVPDDERLHADLTSAEWGPSATRFNTSNELVLEDKDYIRKRLGASPDLGDAAALTFAVPHASIREARNQPPAPRRRNPRTGY